MQKILMVFCSWILVVSLVNNYFTLDATAVDYTGDPYVTDSVIKKPSGTVINEGNIMEVNATYYLQYKWEIPDNKYVQGDKLYFSIPKEFIIINQYDFILNNGDEEVARAKVLRNSNINYYIEMTFTTNYIETHSNVAGEFNLEFKLNQAVIKEGNNPIQFPPDKIINIEVPEFGGGGGGGGDGSGAGKPTANEKTVNFAYEDLKNPETGEFDQPTKIMKWVISLGKNTMLGKASSFDEIESIIVEDELEDQEMVPYNQITEYWGKEAFGWEKAFFDKSSFHYGPISKTVMNPKENEVGKYYYGFKMDILPTVKKLEADAKAANPEDDLREYEIDYYSVPLDDIFEARDYDNEALITINYKDGEKESWKLGATHAWSNGSGSITGEVASVEMRKVDATSGEGLEGATFDLYKLGRAGLFIKQQTNLVSDVNGKVKADKLTTGDYYFLETKAPEGYETTKKKLNFEIEKKDLSANKVIDLGKLENGSATTEISVIKDWDDKENQDGMRLPFIEVQLYADGEKSGPTEKLAPGDGWKHTWGNLPVYKDGKEIKYTVKEVTANPNYTVTQSTNGTTVTIKNTHIPETVKITGEKTWDDNNNQDGKRPTEVVVTLLANGKEVEEKRVTAAQNWKYEFTNLPKYEDGEKIEYDVLEDLVGDYSMEVNGMDLKNTYTPGKTARTVIKLWDDDENRDKKQPNQVEVELYANGVATSKIAILNEANDWSYTWTDLDEKAGGVKINYTAKEKTVSEYTVTLDDTTIPGSFILNNVYVPETTNITGEKTWDDNNNQDGKRPTEIQVNLYANGKQIDQLVVTEKDNWKYEFTNLPKNEDGKAIEYTVKEEVVKDYTTVQTGNDFKNSHTPEKTIVKGEKDWNDEENQDGIRPNSIEIELYANGIATGKKTQAKKEDWKYEFTDLDKYENGKEIDYTVKETPIDGYTTVVDNYEIYNIHVPEKIDISGEKTWDDGNNQDGIRPKSIKVNLYANGTIVAYRTAKEENNWQYLFEDLPKNESGKEIKYVVKEEEVPGYEPVYDGFDILNVHEPEEVYIKGEKTWDDGENQDGIRPDEIIVNLIADGDQVDERIVTAEDNWAYEFTNLPKYKDGIEIDYRVTEELIDEYSTTLEGNDISNEYTPSVTARTVIKFWNDHGNQDGKRAESIQVQLYADGKAYGEPVELSEENDWLYTWEDLDEMKAGKTIEYTVKELNVDDAYEVEIDDDTTPGMFLVSNEYTPEEVDVSGKKIWDDKGNQDGKRPNKIIVNLLADGEEIDEIEVTAKDKWAYEFTNLPKYSDGVEIEYTVTENHVSNYTTKIANQNLTNKYTPGKTSVTVTKRWDDNNDKDKQRPTSIFVQLYADGKAVGAKENLNKANKWTKTWSKLDEKANGKKIIYTVKETTNIKGYEVTINDKNIGNIIITNKYTGKTVCDPPGTNPNKPDDPKNCDPKPENPLECDPPEDDSSGNNNNLVEDLVDCNTVENVPANTDGNADSIIADVNDPNLSSVPSNLKTTTESLPKTGASYNLWYLVGGVVILIGGVYFLSKRRKK